MQQKNILLTGGAGYIGSVLTPKLLDRGHRVTVLDCLFFGDAPLAAVAGKAGFRLVRGDIRDCELVENLLGEGRFDTLIHLAAISNDPSSDLDAGITRTVNMDATAFLMQAAKRHGLGRFIYASSASVYGIKQTSDVTEDLSLEPITLYAKYKAEGETVLNGLVDKSFCGVSVRAATVCGYSPRLRLDLTINILTSHALLNGRIRVFGGKQMRPNIHIRDLTDFYLLLVDAEEAKIRGQVFNLCRSNASVMALAEMIRDEIDPALPIEIVPTDDNRSYHLSADRVRQQLGFVATTGLTMAVHDLRDAFGNGSIPNPDDSVYRNVVHMKDRLDFWKLPGS